MTKNEVHFVGKVSALRWASKCTYFAVEVQLLFKHPFDMNSMEKSKSI